MILFVFEGDDREPNIFRTIERLYLPKDNIICSFGNNIYELYNRIMELGGDADIISLLGDRFRRADNARMTDFKRSDISETYLFFDYDFHHSQLSLEEINHRVSVMLGLFDEETENGKLYINYPMIESIRYVKELPDAQYVEYKVSREDCRHFKRLAREFSFYDSLDFILLREGEVPNKEKYHRVHDHWEYLKTMNVCKANYIVSGCNTLPERKSDITQTKIFEGQLSKFVSKSQQVAVLNSFPIFIFDYFH
jgi:hypothetical protein